MPQEGQISVTLHGYSWEDVCTYYKKHKRTLKKKGIHSPTALIEYWIREKCSEK